MKKRLLLVPALLLVMSAGLLFSQNSGYQVQAVAGKVERQTGSASWEAITKDMTLSDQDIVSTGLNSILVLKSGERTIVIDSLKKGPLNSLVVAATPDQRGIRAGVGPTKSDAAKKSGPDRTNISTASTRASVMTKDIDWKEGDKEEVIEEHDESMEIVE